jgi:hypothetical protein
VAASSGTVESAVSGVLARIPAHRVRHAREVLSAIATALEHDSVPATRIDSGRKGGRR